MSTSSTERSPWSNRFYWIIGFVAVIWCVEIVNLLMGNALSQWGIVPRSARGLLGILLSPFLHAGLTHVLLNTIPFVVLGGLIVVQGVGLFLELSLWIVLLGGGGVWLLAGGGTCHVGASGLVFGYFGFLVARGWYDRSPLSLAIAAITVVLYGGLIWGVLPIIPGVSWQGHLFGMLAGVAGAALRKNDPSPAGP